MPWWAWLLVILPAWVVLAFGVGLFLGRILRGE